MMTNLNLDDVFVGKRDQKRVAKFMLQHGVQVRNNKLYLDKIEVPYSSLARILDVDWRVVKYAAQTIESSSLQPVFQKLGFIPLLRDIAPELGFGAIEVSPINPASPGIVAEIANIIAEEGINVRQITTEDPMFENAEMVVVTERPLPRELIDKMLESEKVEKISVIS